MDKKRKINRFYLFSALLFLLGIYFFYFKYVPIIKSFQAVLLPVLLLILILTIVDVKWGILFFVFSFPLLNSLPYFFGIYNNVPHAPVGLILFMAFFLGWLIHGCFRQQPLRLDHPIFRPILLLTLIIIVSTIITFFRYAGFFPFQNDQILELIVNVKGVRSGGAIMSCFMNMLNYVSGFLFFIVLSSTVRSREFLLKIMTTLSISAGGIFLFALIQRYYSLEIGNTPYFITLNRLNSTFKDPNSFGFFLSAFLPVLLGLFFTFQKRLKLISLLLFFLSLYILPFVGSRSAILGIFVGAFVFLSLWLADLQIQRNKKIIYFVSFIMIIFIIISVFIVFSGKSNLNQRFNRDLNVFSGESKLSKVITGRGNLWTAAFHMMKKYPLSGVGIGAYIIEYPNFMYLRGINSGHTDSAENYFLQAGAELGLLGLVLFLWLFYEGAKLVRTSWRLAGKNPGDKYLIYGIISGICAALSNFLLHSYIGAFDVKYFFWLLAGLVLAYTRLETPVSAGKKTSPPYKWTALGIVLVFGIGHLWNSTHALSIYRESEKYNWEQNFGLYSLEKGEGEIKFNWTKKVAGISVTNLSQTLVVPIRAGHPGIERHPVRVNVYKTDHKFRKREFLQEIIFNDTFWKKFEYKFPTDHNEKIFLIIETDRTWQPLKMLGFPDSRWLGVCLGIPWFRTLSFTPQRQFNMIQKISRDNWVGKHAWTMNNNGVSRVKFYIESQNSALRLNVRGSKAMNVGPYIIVRLDTRIIGRVRLEEEQWQALVFSPGLSVGEHELSVEFVNDFNNTATGHDRNVYLGDLEIISIK